MRCADCIHEPICNRAYVNPAELDCRDFIDINCFIKLPCKLGEKIYAIVEKKKANKDETYKYIQSYYLTYSNIERVTKNFGKTIFLTPEATEDALAKMNSETETL